MAGFDKMWTIIEKAAPIVSLIGLIGAIAAGLFGQLTASLVMLSLIVIAMSAWIASAKRKTPKIWQFKQELEISSTKKNRQNVDGAFLGWPKCTIMLWVLVPIEGRGLRNAPDYRYILAHQTNDPNEPKNRNLFAVRFTPHRRWEIIFTNDKGQSPPEGLVIPDGLQTGWHHFWIAWDHSSPTVVFRIDEGRAGESRSNTYLSYWPEKQAENVIVGAWVTTDPYPTSYCDTTLFELRIYPDFIGMGDSRLSEHLRLKSETHE